MGEKGTGRRKGIEGAKKGTRNVVFFSSRKRTVETGKKKLHQNDIAESFRRGLEE